MSKTSWKAVAESYRCRLVGEYALQLAGGAENYRGLLLQIADDESTPPDLELEILRKLAGVPQKEAGDE